MRERLKPDLVICKPSEVCALVDVKMDLGYQRDDFGPSLRKKNRLMTRLRGQKFRLLARKGNGRDPITLRLSPRAKYLSVVISDRNIAPAHFNEIEKSAASLGNWPVLLPPSVTTLITCRLLVPNLPELVISAAQFLIASPMAVR